MAFQTKVDYCGLGSMLSLSVRDSNENLSQQKYQPQGNDGSYLATETYGKDSAPTNSYAVAADVTSSALKLGTIKNVGSDYFALESVTITTSAAAAPTISAVAQMVESGASDALCGHYTVPTFTLSKRFHAQNVFGAFTLSGSGCELTSCTATAACAISKNTLVGENISSDINSGVITVSGTILATGSAAPSITPASSWVLTKSPTFTNPETAYKSYTFELQKTLARDSESPSAT